MKKRTANLIAVLLLAMFMLSFTVIHGSAASFIVDGDWRYEMTPANDCYYIANYLGSSTRVTIPARYNGKPVVKVNNSAFFENTDILYVTFSENITEIGDNAFYGCTSLKSIQINKEIKSIGISAFSGCTSLSSVTVNSGTALKSIPANAFYGCTNLSSVTLTQGIETIGAYAFNGCEKLMSVIVPQSVSSIANTAFYNAPKLSIYGWDDTYAQSFAKDMNIPFVSFGTYVEPTTAAPTTVPVTTQAPTTVPVTTAAPTTTPETTVSVVTDPIESTTPVVTDPIESTIPVVTDPAETTIPESTVIPTTEPILTETPIPSNPIVILPTGTAPDRTEPTTTTAETKPGTEYTIGDADLDGKITVKDATLIQKFVANMLTFDNVQKVLSNCDGTGGVNVKDATLIQKYVAQIPVDNRVGQKVYI